MIVKIICPIITIVLIILVIATAIREPEASLEYAKTMFGVGQDLYNESKEYYENRTNQDMEVDQDGTGRNSQGNG